MIFDSRETLGSILTKKFIDDTLQALQALKRDFGRKFLKSSKWGKITCFFQYPLVEKIFGIFSMIFYSREML